MKIVLKNILIVLACIILLSMFIPFKKVEAYTINDPEHNTVYNIRNKASGKYLNVNLAKDANGTNVNQWTKDGSIEQKWKYVEDGNNGCKLYAICSSNGTNRVLDVYRNNGFRAGCNIDIWSPNDSAAQTWELIPVGGKNEYVIRLKASDYLVVTAYGTSNGSGAGTGATSAGNVYLSEYTDSFTNNQIWIFEKI